MTIDYTTVSLKYPEIPNEKLRNLASREESLLLHLLFRDDELMAKAASNGISAEHFQTDVPRRFAVLALKHYGEYGKALSRPALDHALTSIMKTPEEAAMMRSKYDTISAEFGVNSKDFDALWDSMDMRLQSRIAYSASKATHEALLTKLDKQSSLDALAGLKQAAEAIRVSGQRSSMPDILKATELVSSSIRRPMEIIKGVLHAGSKMVYGGPSKAYKSWTLLDLCIGVASGTDWLGFECQQGRVLYVNMELQEFAVRDRIKAICDYRDMPYPEKMDIWNLRGHSKSIKDIRQELIERVRKQSEGYCLIVPDPIYKLLGGQDENSAGIIGNICMEIEILARETGAAVAFGAHYAKGNAAAKESIDRMSGSGVFARDPDAIVTATAHQEEDSYTIDMTLRNFVQPEPFVATWMYPRMTRSAELDPANLKKPGGRPKGHATSDIMNRFTEGMTTTGWQKACEEDGVPRRTFFMLKKEVIQKGLIFETTNGLSMSSSRSDKGAGAGSAETGAETSSCTTSADGSADRCNNPVGVAPAPALVIPASAKAATSTDNDSCTSAFANSLTGNSLDGKSKCWDVFDDAGLAGKAVSVRRN